ncbi:hypothetical protein DFR50_1375 [Roseiarcus fermentans]|uniref:Uncharacterized protein n=1 Tax=Roseiarcus fermentans TaxID=1473586 RepID=A0A366ERL4_9HYPH|nr:hypothetical protein DFR50_1375 [Roseiarcus fermentans]
MGALWQGVLQLILHSMARRALKVLGVGSRLDAGVTRALRGAEKQQACLRRHTHRGKYIEYSYMPNAVDNEVIARLETCGLQDITAEGGGILFHPLLAKVLQRLAIGWVTAYSGDLLPQIVTESGAAPTKRFGNSGADRRFSATDLA